MESLQNGSRTSLNFHSNKSRSWSKYYHHWTTRGKIYYQVNLCSKIMQSNSTSMATYHPMNNIGKYPKNSNNCNILHTMTLEMCTTNYLHNTGLQITNCGKPASSDKLISRTTTLTHKLAFYFYWISSSFFKNVHFTYDPLKVVQSRNFFIKFWKSFKLWWQILFWKYCIFTICFSHLAWEIII